MDKKGWLIEKTGLHWRKSLKRTQATIHYPEQSLTSAALLSAENKGGALRARGAEKAVW